MFDVHASDISGDMNYVYRVTVTPQRHPDPCTQCDVTTPTATPTSAGEVTTRGLSVVVKVAPSDVPVSLYTSSSTGYPLNKSRLIKVSPETWTFYYSTNLRRLCPLFKGSTSCRLCPVVVCSHNNLLTTRNSCMLQLISVAFGHCVLRIREIYGLYVS